MAVEFFTKLFNSALIFQRRQIADFIVLKTQLLQPLRLKQLQRQFRQPAVAGVEAGGFGYFVSGDELEGEGGHGF